jgi:mannose-6-phosphate isomerase-like protein (cupin superfamily)
MRINLKKFLLMLMSAIMLCSTLAVAQRPQAIDSRPRGREDALDPSPVNPSTDPDVSMFINDWRNAKPRTEYNNLIFHDILTPLTSADKVRPIKKGAVLTEMTAISYATLAPGSISDGRASAGTREVFYTSTGSGTLAVNGKTHEVIEGVGFTLTPDFDFKLTNSGKTPLGFYVRTEPLPANSKTNGDVVVVDRMNQDRRVGNHWAHICSGGPSGFLLCTIAPRTMPQPHGHSAEEIWIMVKGQTILSLGKNLVKMDAGQAYKIPPMDLAAHSNINMSEETVQMLYVGPLVRVEPLPDYGRLDNDPFVIGKETDVDMFMGNWRDSFPRMMHGNLYFRDMLTALQGPDSLHPTRRGAVLTKAQAVDYALLEPRSTAHRIAGELKDAQEVFVVNSGTGFITSGAKRVELSKGMSFIITPDLDFKLTATGNEDMSFYVVTEKLPDGFKPSTQLQVVDDRNQPQTTNSWFNQERPLITSGDGLSEYGKLTGVELKSMAMSRPYSDAEGVEEIWIATDGDVDMLFGKQLRHLPAGTAYRVPSTGLLAHANINVTGKPAHFIYMVSKP